MMGNAIRPSLIFPGSLTAGQGGTGAPASLVDAHSETRLEDHFCLPALRGGQVPVLRAWASVTLSLKQLRTSL